MIPTWRRPDSLARCLRALARQTRPAERIVVAIKDGDDESRAMVDSMLNNGEVPGLELVSVSVSGNVVTQMNAALQSTTEDLVAITDDDAEARTDWLEKLVTAFADAKVGGVGGRDWQPHERWDEPRVGELQWFGRAIGNHHLGAGPARDVQILKGVNCCFRGEPLRRIGFDTRMRGKGTVIHWEMALSFTFLREGWRLVYDPQIAVDHHVAPRRDGDINQRGGFERESFVANVHNEVLSLLEALPAPRRWVYRFWQWSVGTGSSPGLLQVVRRRVLYNEPWTEAWMRYRAVREATRAAVRTSRGSKASKSLYPYEVAKCV